MTDCRRKDILDALTARLQGINGSGGYRRTVTTVAYDAKDWTEIPAASRDWIGIIPQSETYTDNPGHVVSRWAIDLVCHLTPTTNTTDAHMLAIVDMATDIRKALMLSPCNLNVEGVHFCRLASRRGTESDPAALEGGVATTVIGIEIIFEEEIAL